MKRIISVLLAFLLIFMLCSCKDADISSPQYQSGKDISVPKEDIDTETENSDETPTPPNPSHGEQSDTKVKEPAKQPSITETPEVSEKTEAPTISTPAEIASKHTPLSKNEYYQYSFLNATEKEVYNKLYTAAQKGICNIDLEDYALSKDTIQKIHNAFTADNPQFFYLSKYYSYTISSKDGRVLEFTLYYSDGTTEDNYDDDDNMIASADRTKINAQIAAFNKKISEILSAIPSNISDLEKEKKIYDYILDNVVYDSKTAEAVKQGYELVTHSFDAYGAACESSAVCEGYTKLFQYLCYRVGINATQIHGILGANHMWNAVLIDGKWYMADATWDDSGTDRLHYYKFFNVTTDEIEADHTIDYGKLSVPKCNSTDAAFYNNFGLAPPNTTDLPQNFKTIVDHVMLNGDKYLCIYRGVNSEDLSQFIDLQIYSPRSEFRAYIAEQGYGLTLGEQYLYTNRYYYIPIA